MRPHAPFQDNVPVCHTIGAKADQRKEQKSLEITVVYCSRCGAPGKLADSATEDARLLKHATRPETSGYCVECAVTDFFKNRSHLAELLAMNPLGSKMLLDRRVQEQFARLMQAGNADAKPEEINWQRIVENWELPFPKKPRRIREKGQAGSAHSRPADESSQDS